jgi:hypothetical protein
MTPKEFVLSMVAEARVCWNSNTGMFFIRHSGSKRRLGSDQHSEPEAWRQAEIAVMAMTQEELATLELAESKGS